MALTPSSLPLATIAPVAKHERIIRRGLPEMAVDPHPAPRTTDNGGAMRVFGRQQQHPIAELQGIAFVPFDDAEATAGVLHERKKCVCARADHRPLDAAGLNQLLFAA